MRRRKRRRVKQAFIKHTNYNFLTHIDIHIYIYIHIHAYIYIYIFKQRPPINVKSTITTIYMYVCTKQITNYTLQTAHTKARNENENV